MDRLLFGDTELEVSDFVALINQTMEYAYPIVSVKGELVNFKISKSKWVYFDLKDANSSVRCFGTVYQMNGPLEDGMMLVVRSTPRLHPRYGFSLSIVSIRPSGEGAIRRAAELLRDTLAKEGLFDALRKRSLPYAPQHVALVTSSESAAYADFVKILNSRWCGVKIECIDVQVQGDVAPAQIVAAIEECNRAATPPEVLVIIRGGGSAGDLAAFNTESVARAVAASRVPTLVAIGHEIDISLAELVADKRASTPSNAAELLVPDRSAVQLQLDAAFRQITETTAMHVAACRHILAERRFALNDTVLFALTHASERLMNMQQLLQALNPREILRRGYAIVRLSESQVLRSRSEVHQGDAVDVEINDGHFQAIIQ